MITRLHDGRLFRAADMGAEGRGPGSLPGGKVSGLVTGTKVATSGGWRAVESISPGDRVLTFDAGMQQVTQVSRGVLWQGDEACPRHLWPLAVPAGALGNAQAMLILPEQLVVIESEVGEQLYGDSFTLVPAAALEGFRGIARVEPVETTGVVVLYFGTDQMIFGSAGALFFCPSVRSLTLTDSYDEAPGEYVILGVEDAEFLIGCIAIDEVHQGVTPEQTKAQAAEAA
jgi:hypothetical protein